VGQLIPWLGHGLQVTEELQVVGLALQHLQYNGTWHSEPSWKKLIKKRVLYWYRGIGIGTGTVKWPITMC
jgi:hypothetical protein